MKRLIIGFLTVLLLAACPGAFADPPLPPPPADWVTDTTGFLSAQTRQELSTRLEAYERSSGHQVLVWIGKTSGGIPIEDWSARVFQAWRVGRKGIDDGVVVFILADDHSARIEVGYGLEGQVPDAIASRILSEEIIPRIKAGDHDAAVNAGVDRLIATLGGENTTAGKHAPTMAPPLSPLQMVGIGLLVLVLLLLFIRYPSLAFYLLSFILSRSERTGNGGFRGGGGRSGGGGASGRW